jgi:hypothetical protein
VSRRERSELFTSARRSALVLGAAGLLSTLFKSAARAGTPVSSGGTVPLSVPATPQQFGAKGDGATDDTAAFTGLIASGAQIIYVPAATYIVNGITFNVANQQIWFAPGAMLKAKAALNGNVVTISAAGVYIDGGIVDGNSGGVTASVGVKINAVADVMIERLTAQNTTAEGIFGADCPRLRIVACKALNTGNNGIFHAINGTADVPDVEVSHCLVDRSSIANTTITEGGIKLHANVAHSHVGAKVYGNTVRLPTNPTATACIGIELWASSATGFAIKSTVTGNCTFGGFCGISISSGVTVAVTGNSVFGMQGTPQPSGIEFAGCRGCSATGNAVDGNGLGAFGIFLNNDFSVNNNNVVSGNTLSNVSWGIFNTVGVGCAHSGNSVFNATTNGIELTGCTYSSASNNVIIGNGATVDGISINGSAGTSSNNAATGNTINGVTANGIHLNGTSATSLSGNNIYWTHASNNGINVQSSSGFSISGGDLGGGSATNGVGIILNKSFNGSISGVSIHDMAFTAFEIFADAAMTVDNIAITGCPIVNCGQQLSVSLTTAVLGNFISIINCQGGASPRTDILDLKNNVLQVDGTGTPASVVTASPGSRYFNRAGGAATTLFVKESATNNTGWVGK